MDRGNCQTTTQTWQKLHNTPTPPPRELPDQSQALEAPVCAISSVMAGEDWEEPDLCSEAEADLKKASSWRLSAPTLLSSWLGSRPFWRGSEQHPSVSSTDTQKMSRVWTTQEEKAERRSFFWLYACHLCFLSHNSLNLRTRWQKQLLKEKLPIILLTPQEI